MKTKVIAELGINHQGDMNTLLELADMAFESGADFVKLQTRTPELCVPKAEWDKPKETPWGETMPYIEYRKKMEFTNEQLHAFDAYLRTHYGDDRWFTSIWDHKSLIRILAEFPDMSYIKIPSALMTETHLINGVLNAGKTPIVSIGMSTHEEVRRMMNDVDNLRRIVILACNSSYPTADEEVNLDTIHTLRAMYLDMLVKDGYPLTTDDLPFKIGFSSHHVSPFIPIYASLMGATFVEVHVTLDRTMIGSDHAASLERAGLELLCREIARIPVVKGDGHIRVYDSELPAKAKLRP